MTICRALCPFLIVLILFLPAASEVPERDITRTDNNPARLLVFTKTEGYRHASIPAGVNALGRIAENEGWMVRHTEEAALFHPDSLATYRGVIFLNTTGDILNEAQQEALKNFVEGGGGFVGIHSATDTEYGWRWYGDMVGAYFESHPDVQEARLIVFNRDHPSTSFLPREWIRTDEWYNFREVSKEINILIRLDESSYRGGKNGPGHPAAWYRKVKKGRMFYTAGGHTVESYSEPLFLKHLKGGIRYVLAGPSNSPQKQ